MRVAASVSDMDMARMDDDGAMTVKVSASATPEPSATSDWPRSLGASHARRDARARDDANDLDATQHAQQLAIRRRWPAIVDAMQAVINRYNAGAGSNALTLSDHSISDEGELAVDVTAPRGQLLTLAIDEGDLWVRPCHAADGVRQGERWIGLGRSDTAIAAYVLQPWMSQL